MERAGYHQQNAGIIDGYAWQDLSQQIVNIRKAHMDIAPIQVK